MSLLTSSLRKAAAAVLLLPCLAHAETPSHLSYEVFVSDGIQRASEQRLPNGDPIVSSPISSTLIYGAKDAVLVDPPLTRAQTAQVADWVAKSGKHLKFIYSTHGHGDHWYGTAQLLERFPGATVYATEGTIQVMRKAATEGRIRYDKDFPGQIGPTPILAQPVPAKGFLLEGKLLKPVEVGHSDTDGTTVLHVPSIGLVVAGDVAYNGVHQYLLEGGKGGLQEWLKAIDKVEALHPRAVVAGHKQKARDNDPACLEDTRQYLLDALQTLAAKPTPREFFDRMIVLHPDRINPGPLWYSGVGLLAQSSAGE